MGSSVDAFQEAVEQFTKHILHEYVSRVRALKKEPPEKEINDAVWKTVIIKPLEVLILDSPLLQRLRYVKQLGVAHWIYPSAAHSRLEHSIGAVHQLQRVLDAFAGTGALLLKDDIRNALRLTALCHDVGHGVMSHVSENAFKELDSIETLLLDLEEFFNKDVQLSEAIAYFMLGSPAFKELLEVAQRLTRHQLPVDPTELMQKAVLGQPIHSQFPLLQELISGPFDVDKLDYMTRDAYMAGIPVVTDIDRLVRKIRLVEVSGRFLPQKIQAVTPDKHTSYYVQAVALSGARTLDELMIGRTLLFDKVYRHQKVRACEAMTSKVLGALARVCRDARLSTLPLYLADEDLLRFDRATIENAVAQQLTPIQWASTTSARDIAARLRDRRLFVRAYAYSHKLPQDPFDNDPEQNIGLEALRRENRQLHKRRETVAAICDLLREMRKCGAMFAPEILDTQLSDYVALDVPAQQNVAPEIARAYLAVRDGELMEFRDDSADSSPWSNAYAMTRDLGYIFAPRELASAVFLAAEAYFRTRYQVRTPDSALLYSKVDADDVSKLREQMTSSGFYAGRPVELRAKPARLKNADIATWLDATVQRLGTFQGLTTETEKGAHTIKVTRERLLAWLRQFGSEDAVDAALRMLTAIRVISREDVHQAVRDFIAANPEFANAVFCPFGSPKDSSYIWTYFVNDLQRDFPKLKVKNISETLTDNEDADRPIAFFDDFLSSGKQSVTIVYQWLDRAAAAPLDEHHVDALSGQARITLKGRPIGFVFAAGTATGEAFLKEELAEEGLTPKVHYQIDGDALPKAFSGSSVSYRDAAQRDSFRAKCHDIGGQLLANYGREREPSWVDARRLGYGNDAYLLVFPYNIPTATLTALWCGGTVDGASWLPLMPRRAKD